MRWGNQQVNDITKSVRTALRGSECTNAEGKPIQLKPVDCTAESVYNTLVYKPWANGEVGSLSSTNDQCNTPDDKRKLAARILAHQAPHWDAVKRVESEIVCHTVQSQAGPTTAARRDAGWLREVRAYGAASVALLKEDGGVDMRRREE